MDRQQETAALKALMFERFEFELSRLAESDIDKDAVLMDLRSKLKRLVESTVENTMRLNKEGGPTADDVRETIETIRRDFTEIVGRPPRPVPPPQ